MAVKWKCLVAKQRYLGLKLLEVRFCTLPLATGNLGELDACERPPDEPREPLDCAGDCLRDGDKREAGGNGGGLIAMSMEEACSCAVLDTGKLGLLSGGTS